MMFEAIITYEPTHQNSNNNNKKKKIHDLLRSSLVFTFTYVCIGVSRCLFLKRHIARPHATSVHADVQKALPGQLDNKHRMVWHGSGIIYLASLLFSSMVFVKSEETICCPVIMGGQGGGDWK